MRGMTPHALLAQIEDFSTRQGIAPATVTSRAVGNSRLYARMKAGGGCTLTIAIKLIDYMASHDTPTDKPDATSSEIAEAS